MKYGNKYTVCDIGIMQEKNYLLNIIRINVLPSEAITIQSNNYCGQPVSIIDSFSFYLRGFVQSRRRVLTGFLTHHPSESQLTTDSTIVLLLRFLTTMEVLVHHTVFSLPIALRLCSSLVFFFVFPCFVYFPL